MRAHILPQALTYPAEKGLPFVQSGSGTPPIKRWSSWYDANIVTQEGENILAAYDDWAIEILRDNQLVWSGWGDAQKLQSNDLLEIPDSGGYGARRVIGIDTKKLRLFFLSLLWRAAVSDMPEFREVDLRASQVRRIGRMLREADPSPQHLFPFSLTQLTTKGAVHNMAPLAQRKPKSILQKGGSSIGIYRFYFDGLIAHFHREGTESEIDELGDMMVGSKETMTVVCVPFEKSWEKENLINLMTESAERWPERLFKIPGFRPADLNE